MKKIKTILCAIVMMCACANVQAQDQQNAIGFDLGYMVGSNDVSNFGIGVKYDRFLTEALRAELSGDYMFKQAKNQTNWFDVNVNFNYLFPVAPKTSVYPIFGFTTMFGATKFKVGKDETPDFITKINENPELTSNADYKDHYFRFGCNLGFGGQYNITDDFGVTLEAKYKLLKDFGDLNIALGCVVLF